MRIFLLLAWIIPAVPLTAQVFETITPPQSLMYGMIPTTDGNYVTVGAQGADLEQMKVWLAKYNSVGQLIWEKTYAPAGDNARGFSVTQGSDGGFIITGSYGSFPFSDGGFVMKAAPNGSPVWAKTFGGKIYSAAQTPDGQWLIGGIDGSNKQATVYRLNASGNILWQHNYPAFNFNGHLMRILPQPDGSFFAAGRGEVTGAGFMGVFILNAQSNGDQVWMKSFDTENYNQELSSFELGPLGAVQASNGDVLIADGSSSGQAVLLRYTPTGEKIWEKHFGASEDKMSIFALSQDNAGNLFLGGNRAGPQYDRHFQLIKTTSGGTEIWSRAYLNPGENALTGIATRPDGTCIIAGQIKNNNTISTGYLAGLDPNGYRDRGAISISLKRDLNQNCVTDAGEPALEGWQIRVTGDSTYYVLTTDADGYARQPVPDGAYKVQVITPSSVWSPCFPPQSVTIDAGSGVTNVDLLVTTIINCAIPTVSITAPDLVRCESNIYYVECQNTGTIEANDVKVSVTLDPWLSFEDASLPHSLSNGKYVFELGNLPELSAKRFSIKTKLSCNAEIGQTHCVEVEASPLPACALAPAGANWSGASLKTTADCSSGTVKFTVSNTGSGDMTDSVDYEIIADGWKMKTGAIRLNAGQQWTLDYPANGRSVWFSAQQPYGHPGLDRPVAGLEGCGLTDNGLASTGFLDMFEHNGRDPNKSYACVENTRIKMPDRIASVPKGYGYYHLIPFDAKPEYIVKFHNTLPNAAQQVRVRVTLSSILNAATFKVTAASHAYSVRNVGAGVFDILFSQINLPAESQDSLGCWGYLRFKADFGPDAYETGARIVNNAQIYFDDAASTDARLAYHFTAQESFWLTVKPSPYSDQHGLTVFPGSSGFDFCEDVVKNPDGTMFLLMTTYSYATDYDLVLVKTDANGRALWQKVYDFDGGEVFNYAVSDGEGGIVATGYQDDPAIPGNYTNDSYLPIVRIDANGKVLWFRREKPGTGDSGKGGNALGMIRSSDGNFVITGSLTNGSVSSMDNFLLKVDPSGQTIWFQNYLIAGVAFTPNGVIQTADGGYLMAGDNQSDWPLSTRWQKVDPEGNTEWVVDNPYTDNTPNGLGAFAMTPDHGFLSLNYDSFYDADSNYVYWPVLSRYDSMGALLWRKTLQIGVLVYPGGLAITPDGGCVFTGELYADTSSVYSNMLLAAADPDGNLLWWKQYDVNTTNAGQYVHLLDNGTILATSQTQTNNYLYNLGGVLLMANADGTLGTQIATTPRKPELIIWPNPARSFINVALPGKTVSGPIKWQLFDIQGKLVREGQAAQTPFVVETPAQSSGIYQLSVRWNGGWATKSVILRGN